MKKLLSMILALCMVFALTCAVGYADDAALVECDDVTLSFCCSAAETTCWAQMANVFADYVNERTTGEFKVEIFAMDQLTNGS
jgi:TRAP-type C4-dicarboxylate transport system substrate-binding protein